MATLYALNQKYHKNLKNMFLIWKIGIISKKSNFFERIMIFINIAMNNFNQTRVVWTLVLPLLWY